MGSRVKQMFFLKEHMHLCTCINRYMKKKCNTTLLMKEIQIKIKTRCHLNPKRLTYQKDKMINAGKYMQKMESAHYWRIKINTVIVTINREVPQITIRRTILRPSNSEYPSKGKKITVVERKLHTIQNRK